MPTWLTTPKMDPALASRVRRSLRGDAALRLKSPERRIPRRGVLRLGLAIGLLGLLGFLVTSYRDSRRQVEETRQRLTAELAGVRAHYEQTLGPHAVLVIQALLEAGQTPQPDWRAERLVDASELDAALRRPTVYARGDLKDMSHRDAIHASAEEAKVDAFYLCLKTPPPSPREGSLLRHLGVAGGKVLEGEVRSLASVLELEDFLRSSFGAELANAEHMSQLVRLERLLRRQQHSAPRPTPGILVYLIDEPLNPGQRSDFDGEGRHWVRIGLLDLEKQELLFRARREVSPEWISEKGRLSFSRPLDSCKLALDLRAELEPSGIAPSPARPLPQPGHP